jgi:carboxyl-terminal processing protease
VRAVVAAALAAGLVAPLAQDGWRARYVESFDLAWSIVNDTFYDPAFGGVDWAAVRDELRPAVVDAESPADARAVTRRMLARLERSHLGLLSSVPESPGPAGGPGVLPVDVRIVDGAVLVTRARQGASDAGLRRGDELIALDGVAIGVHLEAATGLDERMRALDAWRRVDAALRGRIGSEATLDVRRAGEVIRGLTGRRVEPPGDIVRFGNLPPLPVAVEAAEHMTAGGQRVGVVAFNVWMPAINAPLADAIDRFRAHDGLIIDLRGNPGGLAEMIRGVAGHVIDEPVVLGRMQTRTARLEFPVNPRLVTADGRRVEPFAGPVVILVDGLSGSTSECFAGALQSLGRAHVVGRRTMGQALPALTRQLPSGDVLIYPLGDFETATGQALEGAGVVPDEVVPLTPAGLAAGDPDLAAALAWLDRR